MANEAVTPEITVKSQHPFVLPTLIQMRIPVKPISE